MAWVVLQEKFQDFKAQEPFFGVLQLQQVPYFQDTSVPRFLITDVVQFFIKRLQPDGFWGVVILWVFSAGTGYVIPNASASAGPEYAETILSPTAISKVPHDGS